MKIVGLSIILLAGIALLLYFLQGFRRARQEEQKLTRPRVEDADSDSILPSETQDAKQVIALPSSQSRDRNHLIRKV